MQYQYNIPHVIAGVEIAREILTDLHFAEQEKELILTDDFPYIVARGRKGGSNVAAAICNALVNSI